VTAPVAKASCNPNAHRIAYGASTAQVDRMRSIQAAGRLGIRVTPIAT